MSASTEAPLADDQQMILRLAQAVMDLVDYRNENVRDNLPFLVRAWLEKKVKESEHA